MGFHFYFSVSSNLYAQANEMEIRGAGEASCILIQLSSVGRISLTLHRASAASSAEPSGGMRRGNYTCPPYMPHVFVLGQYLSLKLE